MKTFAEIKVGDQFFSTCSISKKELESYLSFSRVKNAFLEESEQNQSMVSGRAILSRIEGEFTRLNQIYGNKMMFIGMDGDTKWGNRNTRFLKPFHIDEVMKIKFAISGKEDINDDYGKIFVDFEGSLENGDIIVISKKNIYQLKK